MTVSWTKHRFSGGLLVLDTTNTVVLRGDPVRSFDRFEDTAEIARFAAAAEGFRSAELGGRGLSFEDAEARARQVIVLREAADRLFRCGRCDRRNPRPVISVNFCWPARPVSTPAKIVWALTECRSAIRRGRSRFEAALAVSALSLLAGDAWKKIRICPNCSWLFVDTEPQFQPALVRHVGLRQPPQGEAPLRTPQRRPEGGRPCLAVSVSVDCCPGAVGMLGISACRESGGEGEYFAIAGKLFVFNYRVATATYLVNLVPVQPVEDGQTAVASFEDPAGGETIVVRKKIWPNMAKTTIESPPLRCVVKDRPYKVSIGIEGPDGEVRQTIETTMTSSEDQTILPDRPLVVGPFYTPNPELAGHPDGKLPDPDQPPCPPAVPAASG